MPRLLDHEVYTTAAGCPAGHLGVGVAAFVTRMILFGMPFPSVQARAINFSKHGCLSSNSDKSVQLVLACPRSTQTKIKNDSR